jgi:hypothetical protein
MIQMLGLTEFGKEIHPQTRNTDGSNATCCDCKDRAKGSKPVFFFCGVSLEDIFCLMEG